MTPIQVQGPGGTGFLTNVVAIAAGGGHSLAVKNDGTVWAWGYNAWGQLGSHGNSSSTTPVQVQSPDGTAFLSGITAVSARGYFSLALKNDGTVWAWGYNGDGELGNGTLTSRVLPAQVLGPGGSGFLTTVTAIASDTGGSLALKANGTVWTWGQNDAGQAGSGTLGTNTTPVQVAGAGGHGTFTGATALVGGTHHSLARKSDGTIWSWGDDVLDQLGYTPPSSCHGEPCGKSPQQVQGIGAGMSSVAAGFYFSLTAAVPTTRLASTTYTYDKLYRLIGATGATGASSLTTYSYDPTGNRLSKVLGGSTTSYTYDKADRILTAGSTSYTVNTAGNLTARGSNSFSYDQANRLASASVAGASGSYVYDGDGKRSSKTVGSTTTNYAYDIAGGLPVVLDDGVRKYVWGAGGVAYSVDKSTAAVQVYHTDGLGSARAISDTTGSVVQTYQTDEFGVPTVTQGTNAQPFGFTGEQRDPEDGLSYLRARMYDAQIGRFLQRDTFAGRRAAPLSLNAFTYVLNNPVSHSLPGLLRYPCAVSVVDGATSSPRSLPICVPTLSMRWPALPKTGWIASAAMPHCASLSSVTPGCAYDHTQPGISSSSSN